MFEAFSVIKNEFLSSKIVIDVKVILDLDIKNRFSYIKLH